MPVTYSIDHGRALIRTRCAGVVTLTDVLAHFATLARDPRCPRRLDVLLDWSDLETMPQPGQLRTIAQEIGTIEGSVGFRACAVVAPRDVVYGLARMFQTFAAERFSSTLVCRTLDEAEAWLQQQVLDPEP
jgi:hypothetical protein